MKRVRRESTGPELAVRRILTELGARYRLNVKSLPGSPDLANKRQGKAVFVHGCFWHFHQDCPRGRIPRRNRHFWEEKLEGNRARDDRKVEELEELGFDVLVVWECELDSSDLLQERLEAFWQA